MNSYQEASFLAGLRVALSAFPALAEEYDGKVVGITGGDTLTLLTIEKRQLKIRLAEIDTPERNRPYGNRARQALADLAFGREARVVVVDHDRYGRVVGRVHVGSRDVNAELVRQGAAWVYRDFARDPCPVCPGGRGPRGEARPMGAARGATDTALGMAAGQPGGQAASVLNQPSLLELRQQALLQGNDQLRGGAVLPQLLRSPAPRWRRQWDSMRNAVPVRITFARRLAVSLLMAALTALLATFILHSRRPEGKIGRALSV